MTEWKLPWSAHCRCERVALAITKPPMGTMACHCAGCQRMSASAFSLSIAFPPDAVTVTGETEIGGLHGDAKHHHCPHCKSWIFTRPDGIPIINVRATMLDDHSWYRPFVETWTNEAFPWAKTGAEHSFTALPADDEWPVLMQRFASAGIHPR